MKRNRQLKSMNVAFVGEETSVKDIEVVPQLRHIIYIELVASIEEAVEKNREYSSLFEINNTGFILELNKDQWLASLKEAMNHFEKLENFEKCVKIRNLTEKIHGQQRIGQDNTSNEQHIKREDSNKEEKENTSLPK